MLFRNFALLVLSLATVPAFAKGDPVPLDLNQPRDKVMVQIERIKSDLRGGEVYSEIALDQRSKVEQALDRILVRIESNGDAGTLPAQQEAVTFNDQEIVNTILTKAREDSRIVCRREKTVGSHRVTSNCITVAERKRLRDKGEQDMTDMQRRFKALNP